MVGYKCMRILTMMCCRDVVSWPCWRSVGLLAAMLLTSANYSSCWLLHGNVSRTLHYTTTLQHTLLQASASNNLAHILIYMSKYHFLIYLFNHFVYHLTEISTNLSFHFRITREEITRQQTQRIDNFPLKFATR